MEDTLSSTRFMIAIIYGWSWWSSKDRSMLRLGSLFALLAAVEAMGPYTQNIKGSHIKISLHLYYVLSPNRNRTTLLSSTAVHESQYCLSAQQQY